MLRRLMMRQRLRMVLGAPWMRPRLRARLLAPRMLRQGFAAAAGQRRADAGGRGGSGRKQQRQRRGRKRPAGASAAAGGAAVEAQVCLTDALRLPHIVQDAFQHILDAAPFPQTPEGAGMVLLSTPEAEEEEKIRNVERVAAQHMWMGKLDELLQHRAKEIAEAEEHMEARVQANKLQLRAEAARIVDAALQDVVVQGSMSPSHNRRGAALTDLYRVFLSNPRVNEATRDAAIERDGQLGGQAPIHMKDLLASCSTTHLLRLACLLPRMFGRYNSPLSDLVEAQVRDLCLALRFSFSAMRVGEPYNTLGFAEICAAMQVLSRLPRVRQDTAMIGQLLAECHSSLMQYSEMSDMTEEQRRTVAFASHLVLQTQHDLRVPNHGATYSAVTNVVRTPHLPPHVLVTTLRDIVVLGCGLVWIPNLLEHTFARLDTLAISSDNLLNLMHILVIGLKKCRHTVPLRTLIRETCQHLSNRPIDEISAQLFAVAILLLGPVPARIVSQGHDFLDEFEQRLLDAGLPTVQSMDELLLVLRAYFNTGRSNPAMLHELLRRCEVLLDQKPDVTALSHVTGVVAMFQLEDLFDLQMKWTRESLQLVRNMSDCRQAARCVRHLMQCTHDYLPELEDVIHVFNTIRPTTAKLLASNVSHLLQSLCMSATVEHPQSEAVKSVHEMRHQSSRMTRAEKAMLSSLTHMDLARKLRDVGVQLDTEVNIGGHLVDMLVTGTNKCVEFDGPFHFLSNMPKLNGQTQIRRRVLRAKGVEVVPVDFLDYEISMSHEARLMFARDLAAVHDLTPGRPPISDDQIRRLSSEQEKPSYSRRHRLAVTKHANTSVVTTGRSPASVLRSLKSSMHPGEYEHHINRRGRKRRPPARRNSPPGPSADDDFPSPLYPDDADTFRQ